MPSICAETPSTANGTTCSYPDQRYFEMAYLFWDGPLAAQTTQDVTLFLQFSKPAAERVPINKLRLALSKATLREKLREEFQDKRVMLSVITECLKAKSVTCRAYDQRGGQVALRVPPGISPANGALAFKKHRDRVDFFVSKTDQLVFGVKRWILGIKEGRLVVDKPGSTGFIAYSGAGGHSFGATVASPATQEVVVWGVNLESEVRLASGYLEVVDKLKERV